LVSSTEIPGYILTSETSLPNSNSVVYNDNNVKDLILHNLGLFDNEDQISASSQNLISKLGTKDLMTIQKLNYVFLLEGAFSNPFNTESNLKHEFGVFNICSDNDSEKCVLKQLFDKGGFSPENMSTNSH